MLRAAALAALLVLTGPMAAAAAPTLHAPSPPSLRDSRPLLSWTLPAGEYTNTIEVSSSPSTTPSGEFFSENYIVGDALDPGAASWQPARRIPAGRYWWSVSWYAHDFSASGRTAPRGFRVPALVHASALRVGKLRRRSLDLRVRLRSNVERVRVVCTVTHGRRRVARRAMTVRVAQIWEREWASCRVRVADRFKGKRLRALVVVSGGGRSDRRSRVFVAS